MILNITNELADFREMHCKSYNHSQEESLPPPPTLPVSQTNWDDFGDLGYNPDLWPGILDVSEENSLNNIPFPIDVLPPKVKEYIIKTSSQLNASPDYLAPACLVVAGTVVGKSRALQLEEGYLVFGNLFTCLVGMSGSGKSPFINKATEPFDQLEPDFTYSISHAFSTAIYKELIRNQESKKKSSSLLLHKDEMAGLFKVMNNKNGNEEKENLFSLFDGTRVHIIRSSSEFRGKLGKPVVSLIGGLVNSSLHILRERTGEDGLMGRMLFAILRSPPQGEWAEADPELAEHWVEILKCLDSLTLDTGTNPPQPRKITMDENAKAIYLKAKCMFNAIRNDKAIALGDSHYSILSKAVNQLGRLTLILTLLKHAEECVLGGTPIEPREIIVDGHTILDALKLLYYFHVNSFHVLHQVDYTSIQSCARELFNYCKVNGVKTISRSEAYSSKFRPISKCTDGDSVEKLFDTIESLGLGIKKHSPKSSKGGRPSTFIRFIFNQPN